MESIYLIFVGILFVLAFSDLIVGVSNDAVNFLNAAVGSKVSSFKVVMIVAAAGIFAGTLFSSGMMEVARKGIFHPQMFYFSEVMIIFLAVIVANVIMLDVFNTFGLPTSTTVSIVFDLLGAAVGMAAIKLMGPEEKLLPFKQYLYDHHLLENIHSSLNLGDFINSSKALAIISGILVSVAIAFTVGAIVQYIARVIFSFNYEKRVKKVGALWGGISITIITYFIIIKGVKGAGILNASQVEWMLSHSGLILLYSFIGWTVLLQLLNSLFKFNILKFIVLMGTFSLAMAFAGNDLVNFIGVPIAGYNAYDVFIHTPGADPGMLAMTALGGNVKIPMIFLMGSGLVMVITLFTSKKARSVIKTSVDLAKQDTGDERFKSNKISKLLVHASIDTAETVSKMIPRPIRNMLDRQFEPPITRVQVADAPAFDMVRASVILVVSSALIAFGTSLQLPLSTTYVSFMVAMGSSLADRAWGRESAVYRISGVFSVIGGWFLTALVAFTMAFAFAFLFYYGGFIAIFLMLILSFYLFYRSAKFHKKKSLEEDENKNEILNLSNENMLEKSTATILKNIRVILGEYDNLIDGLEKENVKTLKKSKKKIDKITSRTKYLKDHINEIIEKLQEESIETAYYVVTVLDYMREMLHSISFIIEPALEHVDNKHKPLKPDQIEELRKLLAELKKLMELMHKHIESNDFSQQKKVIALEEGLLNTIQGFRKNQIKRIKNDEVGTRNSILYLGILNESKNLVLQSVNLYKSQRDFIDFSIQPK
jgi:phosphate/sulfate permease